MVTRGAVTVELPIERPLLNARAAKAILRMLRDYKHSEEVGPSSPENGEGS